MQRLIVNGRPSLLLCERQLVRRDPHDPAILRVQLANLLRQYPAAEIVEHGQTSRAPEHRAGKGRQVMACETEEADDGRDWCELCGFRGLVAVCDLVTGRKKKRASLPE